MKKIFSLLLALICLLCGCSADSSDWVININNEKVSKAEFLVYLKEQTYSFEEQGGQDIWEIDFDGVSAWEVAKQNAANSVTMVKLAVKQAEGLGISSEVDMSQITSEAQMLYDSFSAEEITEMGITLEMIEEIIKEGNIQAQVYQAITQNYQPNTQEVEQYCSTYYAENINMYKSISLKLISSADYEALTKAYTLLTEGADFNQVQDTYSQEEGKGFFMLSEDMYNQDITSVLYGLNEGEFTNILEYEGNFYIFKAEVVDQIPFESVKAELAEDFEENKKTEIYQEQNDRWYSEAKIEKNTDVWESIVR